GHTLYLHSSTRRSSDLIASHPRFRFDLHEGSIYAISCPVALRLPRRRRRRRTSITIRRRTLPTWSTARKEHSRHHICTGRRKRRSEEHTSELQSRETIV